MAFVTREIAGAESRLHVEKLSFQHHLSFAFSRP